MANIIQHHEPFDFEKFYETIKAGYIGIDYQDFSFFMNLDGEKHSFIGSSDSNDRVRNALEKAIACEDAGAALKRASAVMITVIRSPETERPLMMDEMLCINEFITGLPEGCDVVWGLADDLSSGDEVKIILLVAAKD